jgi:hypothetical protein
MRFACQRSRLLQKHPWRAAALSSGFTTCDAAGLTSNLVTIPGPGTEDDNKDPPRIAPRSLFDVSVGDDNLLRPRDDKRRWSLRLTGVNVTNK